MAKRRAMLRRTAKRPTAQTELGALFLTPTDTARSVQAAVALLTIFDVRVDQDALDERAPQLVDLFASPDFTSAEAARGLVFVASTALDMVARRADCDRAELLQGFALSAAGGRM